MSNTQQEAAKFFMPRIIRLRDAPFYLGMKKDHFNKVVRPELDIINIGERGVGFDRLDLDRWVEHHKLSVDLTLYQRYEGDEACQNENRQDFLNAMESGTSTKNCSEDAFAKALALVNSRKRKNTSQGVKKS